MHPRVLVCWHHFETADLLNLQAHITQYDLAARNLPAFSLPRSLCVMPLSVQYDEALRLVKAAIQLAPANARYRRSLGIVYETAEQWPQAADAYERAIEKQPSDVLVRRRLCCSWPAFNANEACLTKP